MNYTTADKIFIETCRRILNEGALSKCRANWKEEDGSLTQAQTKHIFGVTNRYDLSKGNQFPIITLRNSNWKLAMDEILWIWQKKSNNVNELHSHIWDAWADEDGYIGKAYGYQLKHTYLYYVDNKFVYMDQVDKMLYDLKNNPTSRRIMVTMWNVEELSDMNLEPCAYSMTFNVTGNKLNAILNQRSSDMLTAGNWNVVQYSILLMMIANEVGLETGELLHVISDCHIYDRHIPIVEKMIHEYDTDENKNITDELIIGRDVYLTKKDYYSITVDDFNISGYKPKEFNYKIPVAI